jgi:hypothetical protein
MRGIEKGQMIAVLVPPEVAQLVKTELCIGRGVPIEEQADMMSGCSENDLCDVITWLLLNGMRSEQTQTNMLVCQNVANVWKKEAYRKLLQLDDSALLSRRSGQLSTLLAAWKEETDSAIPNSIQHSKQLKETIEARIADAKRKGLLEGKHNMDLISNIMEKEFQILKETVACTEEFVIFDAEQVQEQEQEQVFSSLLSESQSSRILSNCSYNLARLIAMYCYVQTYEL